MGEHLMHLTNEAHSDIFRTQTWFWTRRREFGQVCSRYTRRCNKGLVCNFINFDTKKTGLCEACPQNCLTRSFSNIRGTYDCCNNCSEANSRCKNMALWRIKRNYKKSNRICLNNNACPKDNFCGQLRYYWPGHCENCRAYKDMDEVEKALGKTAVYRYYQQCRSRLWKV